MILADTSIWIDHFRESDVQLSMLLNKGDVLIHSFIIGELALGNLSSRAAMIRELKNLPQAAQANDGEVLTFIDAEALFGLGIGHVDAHLLASARLTPGTLIWTRDRKLSQAAAKLSLKYA